MSEHNTYVGQEAMRKAAEALPNLLERGADQISEGHA